MQHTPLVVGNWKMHPATALEATDLAREVVKKTKQHASMLTVAIAPPALFTIEVAKLLQKSQLALAAQDGFYQELGAFTGEVSMKQLAAAGVRYVIVGHSEQRALGETDDVVAQKVQVAHKHKLTPIVCVGERVRDEAGDFYRLIESQIKIALAPCSLAQVKRTVIAYEPVWAIGTGQTATAEDVKEMQLFINATLVKLYDRRAAAAVQLLYGGSVKAHNAATLQAEGGMHGFLVGGASLSATEFAAIIAATITK